MAGIPPRLRTIKDSYIQHTDNTIAEAKNITNFMYNMNKKVVREQTYRKFLDYIAVTKYLSLDYQEGFRHALVDLGKALIYLGQSVKSRPYGEKLYYAVNNDVYKYLLEIEKVISESYPESKVNEKSITFPNGLSQSGQERLYSSFVKTNQLATQCMNRLVTKAYAVELGYARLQPSSATLLKWISYSPSAVTHVQKYKDNATNDGFVYVNEANERISASPQGNYNLTNIEAGYNEMARERDFGKPSLIERGLANLVGRFRK